MPVEHRNHIPAIANTRVTGVSTQSQNFKAEASLAAMRNQWQHHRPQASGKARSFGGDAFALMILGAGSEACVRRTCQGIICGISALISTHLPHRG